MVRQKITQKQLVFGLRRLKEKTLIRKSVGWNGTHVDTGLLPEERNRAPDLDVGGRLVAQVDDLLRFREVGHLAQVVDASDLKPEIAKSINP